MAGRKRPDPADRPPQSDPSSNYRRKQRRPSGPPPPTIWQGGGGSGDEVTFVSGNGDDPFIQAMRQIMMMPMQDWTQGQRAQPTRYPETSFRPQQEVKARRDYNRGQQTAAYTPPSEARRAAGSLRSYSEQQRQPGSESRLKEAFIARPESLPPLTYSAMRDGMLRELFRLSQGLGTTERWVTGHEGVVPTLYPRGNR